MNTKHRSKLVHEGQYVAEVDIDVIETDTGWSPYLSLDDAYKLDDVRSALRRGEPVTRPVTDGADRQHHGNFDQDSNHGRESRAGLRAE